MGRAEFTFGRIKRPQGTKQIYVTGINEINKIDDHTVDLILSAPQPILLRNIIDFRMMSKAWAKRNAMIKDALVRTRDDFLLLPLRHQMRPWAMKAGVTTVHRSDDRPEARIASVK